MRVQFTQSGGFAGTIRRCSLDTSTMSQDEARTLEELVKNADLSGAQEAPSASGRDLEDYEISVEADGRTVTMAVDQSAMSPGRKALVGYLKKCAKPGAPR